MRGVPQLVPQITPLYRAGASGRARGGDEKLRIVTQVLFHARLPRGRRMPDPGRGERHTMALLRITHKGPKSTRWSSLALEDGATALEQLARPKLTPTLDHAPGFRRRLDSFAVVRRYRCALFD